MEQEPNQKIIYKNFQSVSCIKLILILLLSFSNTITLFCQTLTAEQIYEKVKDAVVVILAYDYADELAAQGSGVVLNDKGYVVTNYHVLSGNERLEILHGDEIIPYVDIIGIDVEKDILILQIEEKRFPSLKIGDVKSLKVGQRIYAIGSPMGFENTISEGIISGLRSYEELRKNYIQITASISPGSSGGAVVNDKGELIGISTSTIQEGQNLNFAIPIGEIFNVHIGTYGKNYAFKSFEMFYNGNKAIEQGDYKNAIEFFTSFIKQYSNIDRAYINRGYAKDKIRDFSGAIEDYNKAIELNPNDAVAYSNRAAVKHSLGDYYGALQDNNRAIEIDPNYAAAFYNRGRDKDRLHDYGGAIKDYDKAIEIDPHFQDAYYNRGCVKDDMEDYRGAIQDYNKAIEINPNDLSSYFMRGVAKYNLGDKAGACLDWSKAGELGDYEAYKLINEYCK